MSCQTHFSVKLWVWIERNEWWDPVKVIQKKLAKGQSIEQIADAVEESVDVVTELIEEISKEDR